MIGTVHFTAGAVIGSKLGNPFLAFLFGFFIHFLLDAIPHKDYGKNHWTKFEYLFLFSDFFLLFVLIFFVFKPEVHYLNPFLWGGLGGIIPDVLVVLSKNNFVFHKKIHSTKEPSNILNIVLQISLLFLLFLIR